MPAVAATMKSAATPALRANRERKAVNDHQCYRGWRDAGSCRPDSGAGEAAAAGGAAGAAAGGGAAAGICADLGIANRPERWGVEGASGGVELGTGVVDQRGTAIDGADQVGTPTDGALHRGTVPGAD